MSAMLEVETATHKRLKAHSKKTGVKMKALADRYVREGMKNDREKKGGSK